MNSKYGPLSPQDIFLVCCQVMPQPTRIPYHSSATPRGRKRLPRLRPGHTPSGHNRRSGSAHACSITAPHVHTYAHKHTCVCTYRDIQACTHMHKNTCACTHVRAHNVHIQKCIRVHIHRCACKHTHIHSHTMLGPQLVHRPGPVQRGHRCAAQLHAHFLWESWAHITRPHVASRQIRNSDLHGKPPNFIEFENNMLKS